MKKQRIKADDSKSEKHKGIPSSYFSIIQIQQKRGRKGVEAAPCEGDDSEKIIEGREGGQRQEAEYL